MWYCTRSIIYCLHKFSFHRRQMLPYPWFYRYPSTVDHQSFMFLLKGVMQTLLLYILLLAIWGKAEASLVDSLYGVDILVADESAEVREQAFQQGLDEVFIRIAGDSIVMDKLKRPSASRYVQLFSYEPVADPVPDEQGRVLTHHLKIQYNGSLMEKYLLDNGFAVWGEHRPDVVIWLAVRDGSNEYVLKEGDRSQLKTIVDTALTRRGIPEHWPLYDKKDKQILTVADIRGGFKDPVIKASKRYSRGPALTGSMIWNGKEWQSSWSLILDSGNRHWSLDGTDYNSLLNKAVDQAADALGVVFAITDAANKQNQVSIQLDIQGVNSVEKYRHVESYLSDLSSVTLLRPLKVDGQSVIFELRLRSSESDFLNLIHNDAEFIRVEVKKAVVAPAPAPVPAPVPAPAPATAQQPSTDIAGNSVKSAGNVAEVPVSNQSDIPPAASEVPQIPLYHYKLIN